MTKLSDVIHLYIGCEVEVAKHDDLDNKNIGRICEVTRASNHGDWIRVWFKDVVEVYSHDWGKQSSNCHSYFIESNYDYIKPILRQLDSMTEQEAIALVRIDHNQIHYSQKILAVTTTCVRFSFEYKSSRRRREETIEFNNLNPKEFLYLLSKGFDLFGLIESNQAIKK